MKYRDNFEEWRRLLKSSYDFNKCFNLFGSSSYSGVHWLWFTVKKEKLNHQIFAYFMYKFSVLYISGTSFLYCTYQVQVSKCKFHLPVLCTVHVMYKFFSRYISCTSSLHWTVYISCTISLHWTVYISCTISLHFNMSCTFHVQVLCTENIMFSALFILCNVQVLCTVQRTYRVQVRCTSLYSTCLSLQLSAS